MDKLRKFYNTVLSQAGSSCGNFLFVGNNYGEIFVHNISEICIGPDSIDVTNRNTPAIVKPVQILNASVTSQIYSLVFHNDTLIVGVCAEIIAFNWTNDRLQSKRAWEVKLGFKNDSMIQSEVNSMWVDPITSNLYAACGETIFAIDLSNGTILTEFSEHSDYIHCICSGGKGSSTRFFTAAEDGRVIFWDARKNGSIGHLEPYKEEKLNRPEYGKWQGTVSVMDDWLLCGGGPKPSLWHLRSLECTTIYDFPERVHVSGFLDDNLYLGGDTKALQQYNYNGENVAEIPVSAPSIYSVFWQTHPIKILSIGGSSNCLDICTTFNYKDIVVPLYL